MNEFQWEKVCKTETLSNAVKDTRMHVKVRGRFVSIIRYQQKLHCIDSVCYHMGGPLTLGDIEDIAGVSCVKCPWHHYYVGIDNGLRYHNSLIMENGKMVSQGWQPSNQPVHRIHHIEERNDGYIYVSIDESTFGDIGDVKSDHYAYSEVCGKVLLEANDIESDTKDKILSGKKSDQSGGFIPSGQIFQMNKNNNKINNNNNNNLGFSNSYSGAFKVPMHSNMKTIKNTTVISATSASKGVINNASLQHESKVEWSLYSLESKVSVSRDGNSWLLTFQPHPPDGSCLDMKCGEHLLITLPSLIGTINDNNQLQQFDGIQEDGPHTRVVTNKSVTYRPYTPVKTVRNTIQKDIIADTSINDHSIILAIKAYPNGISQLICNLLIGENILIRNQDKPSWASLTLEEDGCFCVRGVRRGEVKEVVFLMAGSGITPALQIIQEIAKQSSKNIYLYKRIIVVISDRNRNSAMCMNIFDTLITDKNLKRILSVIRIYTETNTESRTKAGLSVKQNESEDRKDWEDLHQLTLIGSNVEYENRRINLDFVSSLQVDPGPSSLLLWCGPEIFCEAMAGIAQKLGHDPANTYEF